MASEPQLVPLSDEELTKLATLAIEAKEKAYCKFSFMVLTVIDIFAPYGEGNTAASIVFGANNESSASRKQLRSHRIRQVYH
jgi:hypothetical protein